MSTNQSARLRDVAARDTNTALTRGEPPKDFPAMLDAWLPEIRRALPKHMDGDRMARIALTEFRKNPTLGKCEPKSVFAAVVIASQLGLEPGVLGQAYLVPYYNTRKQRHECQLIPGWQGYADLVARAGRASVWTGAVYQGDEFDYGQGDRPFISHKSMAEEETEEKLLYCYAVGRIKNSEWPVVEVWPVRKIRAHLKRYNKQGDKHYALNGNLEMYGRKVALLQVMKYMPKSTDVASLAELDRAQGQGLDLKANDKGVLEGVWSVDDDAPQGGEGGGEPPPAGEQQGAPAAAQPDPDVQRVKSGDLNLE